MPRTICQVCARPIPSGSRCSDHPRPLRGSSRRWRGIRARILKRDAYRCRYCGGEATHVDHVLPVDQGGTDSPDNLVAACQHCNIAKGNRTPGQWKGPTV